MSNDLGSFYPITSNESFNGRMEPLHVTATVQKCGGAVSFRIGESFCVLSGDQVQRLAHRLFCRVNGVEGYTATDEFIGERQVFPEEDDSE